MRINSNVPSLPTATGSVSGAAPKTSFQNVLAGGQSKSISSLKNDLKDVARELKAGKITEEQATKQFVDLVIAKRNELNLSPDSMKKIQTAVGDLVSGDQAFVSKLQNELKRI
ncbi:MAG: hypothetical protein V4534_06715 [Myxococcota bacterium]